MRKWIQVHKATLIVLIYIAIILTAFFMVFLVEGK